MTVNPARTFLLAAVSPALLLALVSQAAAQDSALVHPTAPIIQGAPDQQFITAADPGLDSVSRERRKVTPLIAPIPSHNPQLGWGLALVGMLIHRIGGDTVGPPSTAVVVGFASENGSWGGGAGELAHLDGDAWRVKAFAAYFSLKYKFFGIGQDGGDQSVGIHQTIFGGRVAVSRRVSSNVYLGLGIQAADNKVELQDPAAAPVFADFLSERASVVQLALLPTFELDSRNDQYFPSRGVWVQSEAQLFTTALGSDSAYQKYTASAAWYPGFREGRSVMALGALGCYATGHTPFYALCTIGGPSGLRGVEAFRYLDHSMVTLQAEYRHFLGGSGLLSRFGFAVFGGVAAVAASPGQLSIDDMIAAGGAGVRFRLTMAYPLNLRVDVAGSKDGGFYYVSVAENF